MKVRHVVLALAALAAAPAFSQALGTVSSVNGVATVTTSSGGSTLSVGAPLANGSRVITTSNSSATLSLANGCTVEVPPGHGVTLLSTMTCKQQQAAVQALTPVARPAAATAVMGQSGTRVMGFDPAVAVFVGATAAMAIYDATYDDDDRPISGR